MTIIMILFPLGYISQIIDGAGGNGYGDGRNDIDVCDDNLH